MRTLRKLAAVPTSIIVAILPLGVDNIRDEQWHLRFLNIDQAHELTKGEGVTVAVVDTGVDAHPDLAGSVLPGAVLDPAGSGDGNTDLSGHGTAMAGLIAGHGRGSKGVLGIAPAAQILPVVDTVSGRSTNPDLTADAINAAIDRGATVVNISASGGPTERLQRAIERARREDVVVVAAAGNAPSPIIGFPANYPGVVAVGASDRSGSVAGISTRGPGLVLVAPGVDIMTTRLNSGYGVGTGTSDSTAIVSGAVALIRSRFPSLEAAEVIRRLTATATDKGPPGRDDVYGYGVLNVVAALSTDVPPASAAPTSPPPITAEAIPPSDGGLWVGVVALVGVAVVIGLVALHLRARRHRVGRGPVA
ncbi:S8 family serine peptidase [Asanoa siamensis]|uniref:Type VII secretion-associated serine protease n=1 Tax=Asanoa siamensis TaxID=926357 RepID=A0ABQ4CR39_9ACTN|nr:S8 family serine peptidase [Asanoa siamensis]GIF73759.1 type VII secretion-associated serine protease [Asanoa siamensis]